MHAHAEIHATADGGTDLSYRLLEDGSEQWSGPPEVTRRVRDTLLAGEPEVLVQHPGVTCVLNGGADQGRSLRDVYLAIRHSGGVRVQITQVIGELGDELVGIFAEGDEITLPDEE